MHIDEDTAAELAFLLDFRDRIQRRLNALKRSENAGNRKEVQAQRNVWLDCLRLTGELVAALKQALRDHIGT